jgi:hypothetical protein
VVRANDNDTGHLRRIMDEPSPPAIGEVLRQMFEHDRRAWFRSVVHSTTLARRVPTLGSGGLGQRSAAAPMRTLLYRL